MAKETFIRSKFHLLTSTALTRQAAVFGALGLVFGATPAFALDPNALPQDPNVVGGNATFNQSGATLTVNQSSNRTVIDWRSFDIGANATTTFVQPSASSIAVNRVNASANPTEIQGTLNANGQVWILNPNGVLFGKTSKIDVAGIVASTANINVQTFMSGDTRLQLTGADGGFVSNEGSITVADGGLAAFVAPSVRNSGIIQARVGKVTLAAGASFTLDLAGDQLVEIGIGANNALVDQSGKILADGSTVNLTAKAASAIVDSVVNVSGTVLASSVQDDGGTIVLTADNVTTTSSAVLEANAGTNGNGGTIYGYANKTGNYDGSFSAKGGSASGDGGFIETSGNAVNFGSSLAVNASASNGAAGKWLIDPSDITISDASAYVASLQGGTSVEISTAAGTGGNGDITLNTSINAAATNGADLTLTGRHISGTASNTVSISGAGSSLIINVNAVNNNPVGGAWIQDALNIIGTVAGGTTVNVGAGTYNAGNTISKSNVILSGADGAKINVSLNQTGVTINGSNVTLQGFEIVGPVVGDQATLDWNAAGNSWGVQVTAATNANVSILNNNIHNVRTGILIANSGNPVSGAASGTIANNIIEDTKGGILVQYRDGTTFNIYGNSQGQYGNEWGIVTGLQLTKIASDPSLARQAQILAWSEDNNGMTVLDRQYATANRSSVTVDATGTATAADDFNLGNGVGNERQPINNIQQGINAVVAGGTVNVNNGTYVIASGGANYLRISKSLNLIGQSEAGVIIDAHNASSYGLRIIGGTSDVNLSDFTLYGVVAAGGYGIKVEDSQNVNITNVTSKGAYKAQIDLNGLRGGTLNSVTADGTPSAWGAGSQAGAAIAITDSQNILVENSSTDGGSYGGLAIYQSNKPSGYSYQTTDITIAASNTFAEANPVYMEDESATNNFGTITISGFDYAVGNNGNPADVFTWFQKTQQAAIDFATSVSPTTAYVEGWLGSATNNIFTVGYNTAGTLALSINNAINTAMSGATINVGAGIYNEALNITKNLDIVGAGADQTTIKPTTLLATGANHKYDTNMKVAVFVNGASDVNLSGMTIDGNGLGANAVVFWNNASGTISNAIIRNPSSFTGAQTGQGLAVDATGTNTSDLTVSNVTFEDWNKNAIDAVTGGGSTSGGGNINLTVENSTFNGRGATDVIAQNGILIWERGGASSTINATIDNDDISNIDYTGDNANAAGVLVYGSSNGTVTVSNSSFSNVQKYIASDGGSPNEIDATDGNTFDGVSTATATLDDLFNIENHLQDKLDDSANGLIRIVDNAIFVTAEKGSVQAGIDAASSSDTINVQAGTYAEDVSVTSARKILFNGSTLNSYTQSVASAIGGTVTAVGGFLMNAATSLLSNTVLNGAVTAQAIDGSTAGGQALTINGGSNAVALGNLGATTRLGAVNVTGTTSLNGGVYKANALTFNGPSTLTQALTTFDTSTSGGNVTFTGNIFGTTDGLQNVVFKTGSGDISLQNVGTSNIWLGSMSVTGDDFSAATVYVNGYTSVLTGNQTFTSTTLNSKGAVNSSVGGNASGPINSDSNVNVSAGGNFTGNVTAPTGSISGGNITGTFTGNTFTFVASNSVNVTANATTVNLTTPSGTVNGTFTNINTSGGPVVVNGKTRSGNTESNPNQIIVEGYALPDGAIVTPSGEIILPSGMVIGLISPQAGPGAKGSKPKIVLVHSVQKLGELLAEGYVAVVIDLSTFSDKEEDIALAN